MLKRAIPWIVILHVFQATMCLAGGGTSFTESEIRINTSQFLVKIFGNVPPKLVDYYHFDSVHLMAESDLETRECIKRWKSGELDERCDAWLKERASKPNEAESLYYRELRKALDLDTRTVSIEKLHSHPGRDILVNVTIKTKVGRNVKLVLRHASEKSLADLNGLIRINTVNGIAIHEETGPLRMDRLQEAITH